MRRTASMMVDGTLYIVSGSVKWGARHFFRSLPGRTILSSVNWMVDTSENLLFPHKSVLFDDSFDVEWLLQQEIKKRQVVVVDASMQTDDVKTQDEEQMTTESKEVSDKTETTIVPTGSSLPENKSNRESTNERQKSSKPIAAKNSPKLTVKKNSVVKDATNTDLTPTRTILQRRGSSPAAFYGVGKPTISRYIRNSTSSSDHLNQQRQVAKVRPLSARSPLLSVSNDRAAKLLSHESPRIVKTITSKKSPGHVISGKRSMSSRNKENLPRKNTESSPGNKMASPVSLTANQDKGKSYKKRAKPGVDSCGLKKAKLQVTTPPEEMPSEGEQQVKEKQYGVVNREDSLSKDVSLLDTIDEPAYEDIDMDLSLSADTAMPDSSMDQSGFKEYTPKLYHLVWNLGQETGDEDYERFLGASS